MSDADQIKMQANALQKLMRENVALRATISRMRDEGLEDEQPAPPLATLPVPAPPRDFYPARLPDRIVPRARMLWIVTAGSILSIALERLIFWADVAAIGAALLGLFGWISPVPIIPKASHEIARTIEAPVVPAPPLSQNNSVVSSSGYNGGICAGGTPVMTAITTSSGTGMPVLTCSSAPSIGTYAAGGAGGGGSTTSGTIMITTYGGGGGGAAANHP